MMTRYEKQSDKIAAQLLGVSTRFVITALDREARK